MWGHIRIESLLTDVLLLKMLGAHQNTRVLHEIPKENLTFLSFPDKESNGLVRNGGYYGDELGFPGGSDSKESACNAGDLGLIPGLGRSPGEGYDNPLQDSCLENSHGQRSLVGYSPWGRKELDTS